MRDYLYAWRDKEDEFLVASGLQFSDIVTSLRGQGGIILLKHGYADARHDGNSWFEYVRGADLPGLLSEDIYSYGDFCWVDFVEDDFPKFTDNEIAELLYFGHMAKPLRKAVLPCLQNRFMYHSHDDGWFLKLYYANWESVESLLLDAIGKTAMAPLASETVALVSQGKSGAWVSGDKVLESERTMDMDAVLNER